MLTSSEHHRPNQRLKHAGLDVLAAYLSSGAIMNLMKTVAGCLGLVLLLGIPAEARTSVAERFDTVLRVQRGGALEVTETLVMRFESGTFKELSRSLGGRKNDGVEVLDVWMDGRRIAIGDNPGQASLEGSSPVKLRWRFPATSASTHTFAVRYLVVGAVAEDSRGDTLTWRAPFGQHSWRIESSTVTYELPIGPSESTAGGHPPRLGRED